MKTIARKLMNAELKKVLPGLQGRVLDLASKGETSYHRFLDHDRVTLTLADIASSLRIVDFDKPLPYDDAAFDGVVFCNALYIAAEPESTLKECRRILAPHSMMILAVPFIFPETREPHDYARWTSEGIMRLLGRAGFTDVSLKPYGGHFTSAAYLVEAFLVFRPLRFFFTGIARFLDRLIPKSYTAKRPCPLGYVIVCRKD